MGHGVHSTFSRTGTVSFLGVQRPEGVLDHSPPSIAEVKEIVGLYFYPCLDFVVCSRVKIAFYTLKNSSAAA